MFKFIYLINQHILPFKQPKLATLCEKNQET